MVIRTSAFGQPFINLDAGYITSNDKENLQNMREIMRIYKN